MFCPECGEENPDTSQFCIKCEYNLPDIRPATIPQNTRPGKIILYLIIAGIVFSAIFFLAYAGGMHALNPGKPSIHIEDIKGKQGPSSLTISFRISNSGDSTAQNVSAYIEILPAKETIPFLSQHLYIGKIGPGESKEITTELPTEGTVRYTVIPVTVEELSDGQMRVTRL